MKKNIILLCAGILLSTSCMDLNIEPRSIITESAVFSSVSGVESYLITCYNHNRSDDFTWDGVRYGWCTIAVSDAYCGVTADAEWWNDNNYSNLGSDGTLFEYWNYNNVREVNYFIEAIENYRENYGNEQVDHWLGEAIFLRANHYFNMAKRYGGLPLTDKVLPLDMPIEEMQIPRSTEYETYKFICDDFAKSASLLKSETGYPKTRATKAAALGMLSRAALTAGTIAKYNGKYSPYNSSTKYQGIEPEHANYFLEIAYKAAEDVEKLNLYSLEPDYYEMFGTTKGYDNTEYIMIKEWKVVEKESGNSFVTNSTPKHAWLYSGYDVIGFNCPTFDLVQLYEDIDGGPASRGFEKKMYKNGTNESSGLIEYANPSELFEGKDPRLAQTVILPFSQYYGNDVIIRKGLIMSNGTVLSESNDESLAKALADNYKVNSFPGYDEKFTVSMVYDPTTNTKKDGFSRFGAAVSSFDGVHPYGTSTGFYVRKFNDEKIGIETLTQRNNEVPFPIIRYGEVLLNKAEAAAELGKYTTEGLAAINEVRSRAGIRDLSSSEFTVENVRIERQIELALEQHTYWDKKRWRVMHEEWIDKKMKALHPYLDYTKKVYVFKEGTTRASQFNGTYDVKWYYNKIPTGQLNSNPKLIQNYGY